MNKNKNNRKRIFAIVIITMIIAGMVGSLIQTARPAVTPKQPNESETADTPVSAEPVKEEVPSIEAGIHEITKYGNITLTVSPSSMRELGFEPGDIISVTAGGHTQEMPIGSAYTDVDSGQMVCAFRHENDSDKASVVLAVNMGNFAASFGIADKEDTEEDPGYIWNYREGFDEKTSLHIEMKEKGGYLDGYEMHQLTSSASTKREDYADLSDADYANFREIHMGSIGKGILYRSSSPVDPVMNRNKEADAALQKALIKTVMNMADFEKDMKLYENYSDTFYSECDIIALNMGMNVSEKSFTDKLADGLRFIASHEGPYLIHCTEGKDRTGFVAAVLESLMGASPDEIIEDYMRTYINYYHLEKDSELYTKIANQNIRTSLQNAFGIEDLYANSDELSKYAETYLKGIGLSTEEIEALKKNLSADFE